MVLVLFQNLFLRKERENNKSKKETNLIRMSWSWLQTFANGKWLNVAEVKMFVLRKSWNVALLSRGKENLAAWYKGFGLSRFHKVPSLLCDLSGPTQGVFLIHGDMWIMMASRSWLLLSSTWRFPVSPRRQGQRAWLYSQNCYTSKLRLTFSGVSDDYFKRSEQNIGQRGV